MHCMYHTHTHTHTHFRCSTSAWTCPLPPITTHTHTFQVFNVCVDVLAEIELAERERAEAASQEHGGNNNNSGSSFVRSSGSGQLHGLEVRGDWRMSRTQSPSRFVCG